MDNKEQEVMKMTDSISKKLELFATQTGHDLQNLKEYKFMTKGITSCFSKTIKNIQILCIARVIV